MATETNLRKDIEELVNKTVDANKEFISESSRLFRQMATNPGSQSTFNIFQQNFFPKALNAYASLNIRHLKNMIDLGMCLTKEVMGSSATKENEVTEEVTETAQPAFALRANAKHGEKVMLQFVLDNFKKEETICEFVNTPYLNEADPSNVQDFETVFSPQSFSIDPGESKTINITIDIFKNTIAGIYTSNVQVKGFEPAFFTINITVD